MQATRRLSDTHAPKYKVERPGSLVGFQLLHRPLEPMPFGCRADQRCICYSIDREQLKDLIRTYDYEGTFHAILADAARQTIFKCRRRAPADADADAECNGSPGGGAGGGPDRNGATSNGGEPDALLYEWAEAIAETADEENKERNIRNSRLSRVSAPVAPAGGAAPREASPPPPRPINSDGSFHGSFRHDSDQLRDLGRAVAGLQQQMALVLERLPPAPPDAAAASKAPAPAKTTLFNMSA